MKKEAFIRIRPVSPQTASLKSNISACVGFLCLFMAFALVPCGTAQAQSDALIITVKTDNDGIFDNTKFTIPTIGGGYNYEVDWNDDGTYDQTGLTGNVTHDYGAVGTYTLRIRGTFPRIYFKDSDEPRKLILVKQWGNNAWTSMSYAFHRCTNLNITATDLPNLSNVTDMSYMFAYCSLLNGPSNINNWNTANVTNMNGMFYQALIFNQPIGNWNTANVTTMSEMFIRAYKFNQPIGNWNTANVTNMNAMFAVAQAFNQPIGNWNTANVTNMSGAFAYATDFNQPIGNWNTAQVTNMSYLFDNAYDFNQPIGNWNTSAVTNMGAMFYGAAVFNQPISNWDVSHVTNMGSMFAYAAAFNQPIGNWDVSNVTNMSSMFNGATAFNQAISNWDVSHVTHMSSMFAATAVFNQPIGNWNTTNVITMDMMFHGASAFNQPIGNWDVSGVTNMASMFNGATVFNQPIGNWNTTNVTSMYFMFSDATAFNQPIGDWNTAAVNTMIGMFSDATAFNQPIGNWNTALVTKMGLMFSDATAFNQPLSTWTLNASVDMRYMLDDCGMDCENYSVTLIGWANNPATPAGCLLGAQGRLYGISATSARTALTGTQGWTINGDAASGLSCEPCPALTAPPSNVSITNSTCSNSCTLTGGSIIAPSGSPCPLGSTLQYQVNGGAWTTILPIYDQEGPGQTVKTRCSCDWDNTLNSPASSSVTTVPGICAPPSFTACPTVPITVNAATGQCSATLTYTATATGSPMPTLAYALTGATVGSSNGTGSGSVFEKGSTTVTVTATNVCSPAATCVFTVTVTDNQPPSITCPSNLMRNTDAGQCSAVTQYSVTASDNCPGVTTTVVAGLPSGTAFPKGTTTVELKATDPAGLTDICQFTVTVVDAQNPSIVCPANIVRSTDANLCSAVVTYATPSYSDNCAGGGAAILPGSLLSGSVFPKGVNLVSWQATDAVGLTAICQFTVTVNDAQLPSIACPSNQTVGTTPALCTGIATFATPTSSDNCALPSNAVTQTTGLPSGSAFPKGPTIVTFKVTDAAALTKTCTFRVTVNDTENPLIACPSNQSANTDAGTCAALVTYPTPTATDNCGSLTVARISGPASGSSFPAGTTNVVWRAIDGAGRSSTCSFAVTVTDAMPPSVVCPQSVSVTGSGSPCMATVTYTMPTFTDNCAVQSLALVSGLVSGSQFPAGATVNIWRATDNAGLSNTCSFTVTVGCGTGAQGVERGDLTTFENSPNLSSNLALRLAPNPATTEVQISIENLSEAGGELTVLDAQGRLMWQSNVQGSMSNVPLENFAAGLYFVTLRSSNQVAVKQLMVSKL